MINILLLILCFLLLFVSILSPTYLIYLLIKNSEWLKVLKERKEFKKALASIERIDLIYNNGHEGNFYLKENNNLTEKQVNKIFKLLKKLNFEKY